ncbi:MAG: N-acetylneuraminate lyase [Clostridia bacterium]|nr:N-acetylneuraminate lyase [Clostridia bacterium]
MENTDRLRGVFTALLTPFDKNDRVDPEALSRLVEFNLRQGVSGFYVNGSTAEVFMLTDEERLLVYRTVAEAAAGRAALIAHVGTISTAQSVRYGEYAASLGYDAISAVAPFYYKFGFAQIKEHYFTIQRSVGLPMIVYNFPGNSGVNLTVEQIGEFLSDDGFAGVKHTSNDYFAMQTFKAAFPDKVIYNGYDEMFLCGLAMGADGGIGSTYNFMADKFVRMSEKFSAGDVDVARDEQACANRIIRSLIKIGVAEGEKEVLCQMGIDMGRARAPYRSPDSEMRRIVEKEILPLLTAR